MTMREEYAMREEYLANAVECQRMARVTRSDRDRLTWLDMALSWLRKALRA